MKIFKNPEALPLEHLQLKIERNGVIEQVPALSERWVENRYFLHYEPLEIYANGSEVTGAKEHWMEVISYIIDDLKWLLSLPFYRFWSNIIHNSSILDSLVSCLQGIPPFYALEDFPNIPEMMDLLEMLRRCILVAYARLITNKDSPSEYMSQEFFGNLLYHNFIFTIPVIFDLSQLYGRENAKTVEKIFKSLFTIQPFYYEDITKSVTYIIEALKKIERKFDNRSGILNGDVSYRHNTINSMEVNSIGIEDTIFYILDIFSNILILIENYPPLIEIFHNDSFITKIVSIYENTIPKMYQQLDELVYKNNDRSKYTRLKHLLDVTRMEMLSLYRNVTHVYLLNMLDKQNTLTETEIKDSVNNYLILLTNTVSEKEFITDYNQFYPIEADLDILSSIFPEIDAIKREYLLQSVFATIGDFTIPVHSYTTDQVLAGPSRIENNDDPEPGPSTKPNKNIVKDSVELASLVTAVKDILSDLGDGFIEKCLEHYRYDTESVINAVLEDTLPSHLRELDFSLPRVASKQMESLEIQNVSQSIEKWNISDGNRLHSVSPDDHNAIIVHKGKKQDSYRNFNEILNDKSQIRQLNDIYNKYRYVTDDYEDEYDDTYDSHDIGVSTGDDPALEPEFRPFRTPRVFSGGHKDNTPSDDETEEDDDDNNEKSRKTNFPQRPPEYSKFNSRKHSREHKSTNENVIGKPRGQGQDKEVVINRAHKNINKASRANHNRRAGAQWKRRQGMFPS